MIPLMSYWVLYVSCGNEDGWPWLSEKGGSYTSLNSDKRWGYFKDDVCFMKAKPSLIALDMIYLGYMTENYIEYKYWVADTDKTTK